MSTSVAVKRDIRKLNPEERADLASKLFIDNAKGTPKTELQKAHNLTYDAVTKLINEWGAFQRKNRGFTKEAGIAVYDYLIRKSIDILDNPDGVPAIVWAKAFEGVIQSQTRKDKLLGHEAPNINVNAGDKTVVDLLKERYGAGAPKEEVSPMDAAMIGEEEIVEGEVVDDDYDEDTIY